MKKTILLLIGIFFVASLFGQITHGVYIEIKDENQIHPASVEFYAWIEGRENEIISLDKEGCHYFDSGAYEGTLSIQCAAFATQWNPEEILKVNVISNNGLIGSGDFILSDDASQFFGDIYGTWSAGPPMILHQSNYTAPTTDFEANIISGTAPLTVHFNNLTQGSVTAWYWDFYNNSIIDSNEENPTYTYELPGIYSVFLLAKNEDAFSIQAKQFYITVFPDSQATQNDIVDVGQNRVINYPNPFNPITTFKYDIQQNGNVELTIFNMKGQKIKTLVNTYKEKGSYEIIWNGKDDKNNEIAGGVYFYKLSVNNRETLVKKCILLK